MQAAISRGFQQLEEQLQESGLVFVLSGRWAKCYVKMEARLYVSQRARSVAGVKLNAPVLHQQPHVITPYACVLSLPAA